MRGRRFCHGYGNLDCFVEIASTDTCEQLQAFLRAYSYDEKDLAGGGGGVNSWLYDIPILHAYGETGFSDRRVNGVILLLS